MAALSINSACCVQEIGGISKMVFAIHSGATNEIINSGKKMTQQKTTFKKSTGMTAFLLSEIFLKTS